jgi:hypothetical protein
VKNRQHSPCENKKTYIKKSLFKKTYEKVSPITGPFKLLHLIPVINNISNRNKAADRKHRYARQ